MHIKPSVLNKYITNSITRLTVCQRVASNAAAAAARAADRRGWLQQIKALAENGQVALICWQRDCDLMEATSRALVPANAGSIDLIMERDLANAEGPCHHWLQRPSAGFTAQHYDRALAMREGE